MNKRYTIFKKTKTNLALGVFGGLASGAFGFQRLPPHNCCVAPSRVFFRPPQPLTGQLHRHKQFL
jgi:hypothetical protein